jgi:hypothetical protein
MPVLVREGLLRPDVTDWSAVAEKALAGLEDSL